jgi:protein-L-isoaspartate O-methyltransferase
MTMTYTATYSPEDNKLRLYASARLDAETYARVKAAGFKWAPKQDLFVAPMWTPERADLCTELAGDIGDEDTSLVERAEERAGRFDEYSDKRRQDSERASAAVHAIADGIPLGQPILVGHHSERHARRDAERIESGMRKTVKMWETAQYWTARAAGALRHAKYKELPSVRARRIKTLEAEARKMTRNIADADKCLKVWKAGGLLDTSKMTNRETGAELSLLERAVYIAGNTNTTPWGTCSDLQDGKITVDEARAAALGAAERSRVFAQRWLDHTNNRLAYERAMLADSGGTVADKVGPEVGGGCRCWASPRGGWSYIQKVNKVSVTVLDNWGNGGRDFTRTIPFDKLSAVMTRAQVEAARAAGTLIEMGTRGFGLCDGPRAPKTDAPKAPADIDAMREALKAGVTVAAVPQLFQTPRALAARVAGLADIGYGCEVLEPSAGTGALLGAIGARWHGSGGRAVAVEIHAGLCERLRHDFPLTDVRCADFLQCNGDLGKFDRIVMNPPFQNGADIKHILHARQFLKAGGRLVALCADGPRQQATLKDIAESSGGSYEPLPLGSFESQGTSVNTALVVIEG